MFRIGLPLPGGNMGIRMYLEAKIIPKKATLKLSFTITDPSAPEHEIWVGGGRALSRQELTTMFCSGTLVQPAGSDSRMASHPPPYPSHHLRSESASQLTCFHSCSPSNYSLLSSQTNLFKFFPTFKSNSWPLYLRKKSTDNKEGNKSHPYVWHLELTSINNWHRLLCMYAWWTCVHM